MGAVLIIDVHDVCVFLYLSSSRRKSSGALHHGNEPLLDAGAGISDALSQHVSTQGHKARHPETGHISQQKLSGIAAGSGPTEEEKTQNVCPAVKNHQQIT